MAFGGGGIDVFFIDAVNGSEGWSDGNRVGNAECTHRRGDADRGPETECYKKCAWCEGGVAFQAGDRLTLFLCYALFVFEVAADIDLFFLGALEEG